jgi:hypothetical protein
MNKVDIYVNGQRLDVFQDEEINLNISVQNVQDISKVFTDFTQGFTVPASPTNNAIFGHYYRTDVSGTFDGRFRQAASIEINSLPFRTGVVELDSVQLKGTEPYAYNITFYGDLVNLSDLFGDDYLYDLNFSAYDHPYTDDAIFDRFTTEYDNAIFYPLMSPVKNWYYDSDSNDKFDPNLHFKGTTEQHGIHYYELKPALKVYAILDAIEAKYGITFTGSFLSANPFVDLSLWLHRREGWTYEGQTNNQVSQKVNFNQLVNGTFNLTTDQWTVPPLPSLLNKDTIQFAYKVDNIVYTGEYFVDLFRNDTIVATNTHTGNVALGSFSFVPVNSGEVWDLRIRPSTTTNMTFRVYDFIAFRQGTTTRYFTVNMTLSGTYLLGETVVIQSLMPEIKIKDFLAGILKMYNMVIVPITSTSFLLQPLDDWYAAGTDQTYQNYFDITEYAVNRPPLYREIEFKYQDTEQILGYQYQRQNNTGFGDLRNFFSFDADEFIVELPFECPLFERLTDQHTNTLTNVLVYKSITNQANEDGTYNPYLGAPVIFYASYGDYDISENPIAFVNADNNTSRRVDYCWYANTSNLPTSAGASYSTCFGADIDPYHLESVNRSLYNEYWTDYITDLYNTRRRILQVDAILPLGAILSLNLKNAVIWNNNKYIVNNVNLNMTTGKATFELLNVV